MALVTHQIQGSKTTFWSTPSPWRKGMQLKQYVTNLHMVGRSGTCMQSRKNVSLRWMLLTICSVFNFIVMAFCIGSSQISGPKFKLTRISAFKGTARNDELDSVANGSKVRKNSTNLKDGDYSSKETPKANDVPLSYTSKANESTAPSPAVHKLFKKWLTLLHTQPPSEEVDGISGDLPTRDMVQTLRESDKKERFEILKAIWFSFLGLEATIKIPVLVFIPLYLAVNVFYGPEVSKELAPFWVLGPLITAIYIKMFSWLCALYIFAFKQTAKFMKNFPSYYKVVYSYIIQGKLKEEAGARVWQLIVNIKNLNYKELWKRKLKEFEEWIVEKYLDFVESIWPFYCRTIRFLKRANLI